MIHENFKQMASRLADNELDEKEQALLTVHLRDCADCRAFAADINVLKEGFASFAEESPSADINRRMLEKIHAEGVRETAWYHRIFVFLPELKPALLYVATALIIGVFAGGIGFKLSKAHPGQAPVPFISEDEAGLFDVVYPGSISETLKEIKKEKL